MRFVASENSETSQATGLDAVVHLVDDDCLYVKSLEELLQSIGLKVKTYKSGVDFLSSYKSGTPGCLVTDIRMPGISGTELIARLQSIDSSLPVIVVSGFADVQTTVRVMKSGARDLIEKGGSIQTLIEAIQSAVSDSLLVQEKERKNQVFAAKVAALTNRERQVLNGILAGMGNRDMAAAMQVSANTIEVHRSNLLAKLGTDSLADLIISCLAVGLQPEADRRIGETLAVAHS